MIANKWYCIAQTSTFDTRCSINVAFDGHDIQFSASVKYGASSINITRCIIPDGISFSIRLRESGSQWFVDITSSAKITPVVTVADSEYWSSVNKPAAEGNIILLLTDITSKYNTSSFGGDSLFELVNVGTSDVPRYAVVPKVFQGQNPGVISRTFMTFGGLGADSNEDDPSGVSYLRNLLDVRLSEFLEDSDVLTYDKNQGLWVNKKGGFNEEKLEEYLEKYKYITEDDIKGLLVLLQWFEFDDANHAVRVKSDFNFVVPNALSFGGLGSYSGGGEGGVSYLKNLLDVQLGTLLEDGEVLVYDKHLDRWVNKSIEIGLDVDSLQKYLTDNKYITSADVDGLQDQINNNATNIALLLSWLEYDEVNKALRVKNGYNFIVDGALSFGGLGEDDNPTPGGLAQVTIQLGNNPNDSYVSENGKVILPAYPVIPTLLSAFENDKGYLVVSDLHGYAKLTDIPSVEGFALAEDLNTLSKQIEGYDNKFADVGESILDIEEDISKLAPLADLEKLEEAVNPLFGYFDATGSANNALKLGGQLPSYYATVDALNIVKNDITAVSNRVQKFEDVIGIDSNGDVYIKGTRNFYTAGGTIGMAGLGSGGSGGGGGTAGLGSVTVRVNGQDYITDASGIVTIPNYPSLAGYATEDYVTSRGYITNAALNGYAKLTDIPTSLPASDVYAWAKKETLSGAINTLEIGTSDPTLDDYYIAQYAGGGDANTNYYRRSVRALLNTIQNSISLNWAKITSGKPTTLAGYGITDAFFLHATTNYVGVRFANSEYATGDKYLEWWNGAGWVNHMSAKYIVVGGTSSHFLKGDGSLDSTTYLPLSGGTMQGDIVIPMGNYVRVGNAYEAYAMLGHDSSGILVGTLNLPLVLRSNGTSTINGNPLIHTGNIGSQSVSYANSAGYSNNASYLITVYNENINYSAYSSHLKMINCTDGEWYSKGFPTAYTSGISVMSGYVGWQMVSYGGAEENPYFRSLQDNSNWKPWRKLAFLDDNVASADYATNAGKLGGYDASVYPVFEEGSSYIAFNLRTNYQSKGQGSGYIEFYDGGWYNAAFGKVYAFTGLETPSITTSGALQYSAPSGHNFLGGDVTIGNLTNDGQKLLVDGSVGLRGITEITYNNQLGETGWNWYTVYTSDIGNDGDIVNLRLSHSYWYLNTDSVELKIAIGYNNCKIIQTVYNFGGSGVFSSVRVRRVGSTHYIDVYMYNSVAVTDRFFVSGSGRGSFQAPTLCTTNEGLIDSLGLAVGQSRLQDTYIVGNLTVTGGATFGGDVYSEGTMAMARLTSSSDAKLKENIKWLSADTAMGVVRALRPTEWDWKKDNTHSFGFIAQDIQPIIPEMVSSVNDTLRLEYNQLHAFEIGAIQHIDSEVEILKRDLKNANNRIESLENELKQYRRNA